ncbi:MAG: hypothetical protein V1721_05770 [Pseudomonadota bacterium]
MDALEEIKTGGEEKPVLIDTENEVLKHFREGSISVSLKYYMSSCECFSEWQQRELKAFSGLVEKLIQRNLIQAKELGHYHLGKPSKPRFSRPKGIGEDIQFYSLDVLKKARIHGFFCWFSILSGVA